MRLSLSDLHKISGWFEIATQYEDLHDDDLTIHDRILEYLEDKGIVGSPGDVINYSDDDEDDDGEKDYDKLDFYNEDDDDEDRERDY